MNIHPPPPQSPIDTLVISLASGSKNVFEKIRNILVWTSELKIYHNTSEMIIIFNSLVQIQALFS